MRRNPLEWVVLGLSILVVAGILGFLVVDGLTQGPEEAALTVRPAAEPQQRAGAWVVPIKIVNEGDGPAENVDVEAVLMDGEEEVAASSVSLPFVPANSDVEAEVVFQEDPRQYDLEPGVLGYEVP